MSRVSRALVALLVLLVAPTAAALVSLDGLGCTLLGTSALESCEGWSASADGGMSLDDSGDAVTLSPDGSVLYVAGTATYSTKDSDVSVHAFDTSDGALLWNATYGGAGTSSYKGDFGRAIAVAPDGSAVYVTGALYSSAATGFDYVILAYSSAGARQWAATYHGNGNPTLTDDPAALAVTPDGRTLLVTGQSYGPKGSDGFTTSYDWATQAYDAATGSLLWTTRTDLGLHESDQPYAMAISPDGAFVALTGKTSNTTVNGVQMTTLVLDVATGAEAWRVHFNDWSNRYDQGAAIAISPDSQTVYAAGEGYNSTTRVDSVVLAYDAATGAQQWMNRYAATGVLSARPKAMATSPDGATLYVTAESYGEDASTLLDYSTYALSAATGARLWLAEFEGPGVVGSSAGAGNDYPASLAATPDGAQVVVTGRGYLNMTDSRIMTVSYAATTGAESWRVVDETFTGGDSRGRAVLASPDSAWIYVAGQGENGATGTDVVALQYATAPDAAALLPPPSFP